MAVYRTKLKETREVAERTKAFFFEKPKDFIFTAGQFLELSLIDPPETDEKGTSRFFTIASAPFEKDLMIATRMRDSAFKRILGSAQTGFEVEIKGPFGSLVFEKNDTRPVVILTGGIGVTPFRSMILQAYHEKLARPIFFFFSNRRPEDAPFLEELTKLQDVYKNYKCIHTMTQMEDSNMSWQGETGYITIKMVKKYIQNLEEPVYYIAGPPVMVGAMRTMLEEAGIGTSSIHTEDFLGY